MKRTVTATKTLFFLLLYISDRLVVDDTSIVEVVAFFFVKIAEELEQVFRTADTEPEGGYDTDDTDNEETLDEEVVSPHFLIPGGDGIPDHNNGEEEQEVLDETEAEDGPGKNLISPGVVAVNTQKILVDETSDAERFLFFFFVMTVTVGAAMEHSIHIERRFTGQKRDAHIREQSNHLTDEADFDGVDGELVGRHFPDDPGMERT